MLNFDQQSLKYRLEHVSPQYRMLFAVAVAERLFPLYQLYSERTGQGSPTFLRSALDHLWELLLRKEAGHREPFLDDYEPLIPGEGAQWSPLNPLAENAVAALAYACQCQLAGDTKSAAWAAVQGYEAVDYISHTLGEIDFNGPQAEASILKSEYVQVEIQRQLRDLAELEFAARDGSGIEGLVVIFQDRAKSEGMTLVPAVSALINQQDI